MPISIVTNPDQVTITGPLVIQSDPMGSAASFTASCSTIIQSGLTVSNGATVTGGFNPDVIVGGPTTTTTGSATQSLSGTVSTVTMSALGNTIYLLPNSTMSTAVLTPTSSASTSGNFQNGSEITLVNLGGGISSTVTIPSTSLGPSGLANVTISGMAAARFKYIAALQTWIKVGS